MKRRRTEERGGKNPLFLCLCGKHYFGAFNKGGTKGKAAPKPQKAHPKVRKNEVSIAASFFAKQVVLLCTQKVLPLGGDELRANSEKRHKKPPGPFLAVFSAFCVAGGLVAHLGRLKGTTGLKTAFSGIVGFYITTAKQLKNKFL